MKRIATLLGVALLAIVGVVVSASADSQTLDFESYTLGTVNGQDGWSSTNATLDHKIADPTTFGIAGFGSRALRMSNAVTTGSFGDQTFSKPLTNEAGETAAANDLKSGGIRQSHFEAEWDFASTVPNSEQPGLSVVASPDRGDGARMSWVQMADTPGGLAVRFSDYQTGLVTAPGVCNGNTFPAGNFLQTTVATDLDRTVPHTIKVVMDFYDGPNNDDVKVYVDNVLAHTGTSWEGYFNECEAHATTRTVDSILFRTGGTAAPLTAGKGFLIDGFTTTSAVTTADDIYVRIDGSDTICGGTANVAVGVLTGAIQPCAVKTLTQALLLVNTGGTIHVEDGTYVTGAVVVTKDVTIDGNDGTRPIFKPGFDTAAGGHDTDAAAWFLAKPGNTMNLSDLEFDGTGSKIYAGIRFYGDASVDNISVHNVGYAPTSPYLGIGIQVRPGADVDVTDSEFANIGRIGIHYRGPDATGAITNNTFTGKGDGNWLDYAIEAGSGAVLDITGNTISGNTGVATSDGSTSAGILATTYFGPGTSATLTSNTFLGNTTAVAVGYDGNDTSTVVAHYNRMAGNDTGISTTAANVNAENNWWGCNEGPGATGCDPVENGGGSVIDFGPWLVLSVEAPDNINAAAQVAADLNHNSNGIDVSGGGTLPDGSNVTITSLHPNRATVSPTSVPLAGGEVTSTITPAANDGLVAIPVKFDNATVSPIVRVDRVAPTRTITLPESSTSATVAVTLGGTDAGGSGINGYCIQEQDDALTDGCFVYPKPTTFTFPTDGTKTLYAWTRDAAGNISGTPVLVADTVVLDTVVPTGSVAIQLPVVTKSRDISVDVTNLGSVAAYLLSESPEAPLAGDKRWQPTLPESLRLTSDGDGVKTVYAWSKSTGGVVSARASATTRLDSTAPTVDVTSARFVRTQRVPLKITGTDAGSGINGYFVSSKVGQPSAGATGWLTTAPTSAAVAGPDGQKTIYVWTRDTAGNVSATASVSVQLDTTKPTSRILSPVNGSKITKLPFISGVAFDRAPGSGVLRTLVSIRREVGNTCSFWNGAEWVKKGCNARVWMRFPSGENWQVKRGFSRPNFLVEGNYSIFTRAGDRAANVSPASTFVLGVNWVRFQVVAP